jgi:hypothetical protein
VNEGWSVQRILGAGVVTEEEVTGGKLEKQVERISIAFCPVI